MQPHASDANRSASAAAYNPREQQIRRACADRGVSLYVDGRARSAGRPFIRLGYRQFGLDLCLGEFRSYAEGIDWLTAGGGAL